MEYPAVPDPAPRAVKVDCPLAVTELVERLNDAENPVPEVNVAYPATHPVGSVNVIEAVAWKLV